MTGDYKIKEQLQWGEFVAGLLILFVPMGALLVIGNLYPDMMTTPIAVGVILAAILLTVVFIMLRQRKGQLTINGQRWLLINDKNGRTLQEFDLALSHTLGIAIRQGVTGKYTRHCHRWLQVFLEQNGRRLLIESPYIESFEAPGLLPEEIAANMAPLTDPVLITASAKPYTYDEAGYLMKKSSYGMAVHGLPQYLDGCTIELFDAILKSADSTADRNMFLTRIKNMRNNEVSFKEFKQELDAYQAG